jgi:hypothetical protein
MEIKYEIEGLHSLDITRKRNSTLLRRSILGHRLVLSYFYAPACSPTMNEHELVDHIRSGPAALVLRGPLLFRRRTRSFTSQTRSFLNCDTFPKGPSGLTALAMLFESTQPSRNSLGLIVILGERQHRGTVPPTFCSGHCQRVPTSDTGRWSVPMP